MFVFDISPRSVSRWTTAMRWHIAYICSRLPRSAWWRPEPDAQTAPRAGSARHGIPIASLRMTPSRSSVPATRCERSGPLAASLRPDLSERPVEPGQERFDVAGVDGRAPPDAQPGRCVAMRADVLRDAFLVEQLDQRRD